ncbi:unnamed protein product, partial [Ectocarpus sp. 13 AM-2016]
IYRGILLKADNLRGRQLLYYRRCFSYHLCSGIDPTVFTQTHGNMKKLTRREYIIHAMFPPVTRNSLKKRAQDRNVIFFVVGIPVVPARFFCDSGCQQLLPVPPERFGTHVVLLLLASLVVC